jgi:hypothetical protein
MPKRDIRSDFELVCLLNSTISTDTNTDSEILDVADYDGGVTFYLMCSAYTDGTYTPVIQEGDNSALSDAASTADGDMIPQSTPEASAAVSAATATDGSAALTSIGYIGAKRYVRVRITSTSTSSGATLQVFALKKKEILSPL